MEALVSGLGSSKVLVLGTWCKLSSTWYLLVLGLLKFKSIWYLLVLDGQSTWYLSKYSSTFVKLTDRYSVPNLWTCSCQQFTAEHHKQKWFMLGVLTAWVSGCQQSRLDCLLDLQAQHWDMITQYGDKILAITGSGSGFSPVWCKPLQPNWYIVNWTLQIWLSPLMGRCRRYFKAWWHHIATKFWSPLVRVMNCHQFSAKPLHVGLGQFNSKIGIATQFKFQNWKWNWNWWIENIGIGTENYMNGIEILPLLLHHFPHTTGVSDFKDMGPCPLWGAHKCHW